MRNFYKRFSILICLLSINFFVFADGTVQYVCPGSHDYQVTSTLTGSTFNWTITPGVSGVDWVITGQGTESVSINWITPNTGTGYTLTVVEISSASNGNCEGTPQTATIFVNPTPSADQPSDIVLCNSAACAGVTFTGAATSYSWTNNNTSTGLAAGGTGNIPAFTATNTGTSPIVSTITVYPYLTNGGTTCSGTPVTFTITVNPTSVVTITPPSESICSGGTTNISLSSAIAGTTFAWTVQNDAGITGTSAGSGSSIEQTISNSTSSPATATYTVTPSANSCEGTSSDVVVTVNPIPGTSGIILSQPSNKLEDMAIYSGSNPVTFSPVFSQTTYTYSASVAYSISSVTVTPTSVEANSIITVNGSLTGSGTPSLPVNLSIGSNTITISVTSCTGSNQTYTMTVTRSGSANLTALTLSQGMLNPSFASGTTTYTSAVPYDVSSVTVTPSAQEATATIMVNGVSVNSGQPSGTVNLAVGSNVISINVTSSTGLTNTYVITITREGNNYLQNLIVKRGMGVVTINPVFNRSTLGYTGVCTGTPASVTPTAEDGNAIITVNGTITNSGQPASVPLNVGSNTITVTVTPATGSGQRTYTITLTRTS